MEISSQEDHEMPIPLNSTYGGHMIHHHHHASDSAPPPSNGNNNNNGHSNYDHKKQQQQVGVVKYKECLKNHAAAMGGNATDGCGEFMPSGEEGSIEALTCSACNCHRNFHRKETQGEALIPLIPFPYHHHHQTQSQPQTQTRKLTLAHHNHHHNKIRSAVPHQMIMPYMSYMPNSESEDHMEEEDGGGGGVGLARPYNQQNKKRFRTKFSQEQKEKMLSFAERAGWKIQRQDESVVQQFCQEIGVKRRVLKVWMHNNKHNLAKKSFNVVDQHNNNNNVSNLNEDNNPTVNLASSA